MRVRIKVRPPLTDAGIEIRNHVRQPREVRTPVGYDQEFSIHTARTRPSISRRRNELIFERLAARRSMNNLRATYATKVLNRLLIDLSWNSSRLEGNTYSLLDTARLIELGRKRKRRTASRRR